MLKVVNNGRVIMSRVGVRVHSSLNQGHHSKLQAVAIGWRERSFASASVASSEAPKTQNARKRISKEQRQALVESFVNKYRAMNAGKFPTTSGAVKEVGGSYYVVKKIIQELQCKAKMSPETDKNQCVLEKGEVVKEDKSLAKVEQPSTAVDSKLQEAVSFNDLDSKSSGKLNHEAKCNPQTLDGVEKSLSEDAVEHTEAVDHYTFETTSQALEGENLEASFLPPEKLEDETDSTSSPDFNDSKQEVALFQASSHSDDSSMCRKVSQKQNNDQEVPKESSVWRSLKSFAYGVVNIWRKL
ncbi:hypothetical protein RJ641_004665 [Dillenia turbinata]|uniref:AT3G52170-like helix-turn-helix domain-containing protein n=1 Tax=Dillenia turbinata TaxID=194707 RepID=A0AAN8ZA21_9MAGN